MVEEVSKKGEEDDREVVRGVQEKQEVEVDRWEREGQTSRTRVPAPKLRRFMSRAAETGSTAPCVIVDGDASGKAGHPQPRKRNKHWVNRVNKQKVG